MSDPGANNGARASAEEELTFEEALARLEEIVEELEGGQMALEESLARFEEGMKLRATCLQRLEQAEVKIEQVLGESAEETGAELAPNDTEEDETG